MEVWPIAFQHLKVTALGVARLLASIVSSTARALMPPLPDDRRVSVASLIDAYLLAVAIGAAVLPAILAYNVPPSATFFNQVAALIGWSLFAALVGLSLKFGSSSGEARSVHKAGSGMAALLIALAVVSACAAASTLFGPLPSSLSLSALGMIGAALVMVWAGAQARARGEGTKVFKVLCIALVVSGLACVVIGCIQVFFPALVDGSLIARYDIGRAAGNFRQPNHLASFVVWSALAGVWLGEAKVIKRGLAAMLVLLFMFTVAMSASRTGVVEVVVLAVWGLLDKRLSRPTRALLLLAPLFYVVSWFGLAEWAKAGAQVYAGVERLHQADVSSSRFAIWSNAIALIKAQPWLGVGFGEFNLAWTLTPFPGRPVEYFDHPHNLVLHLASELGVPLATIVVAGLCWALWKTFVASNRGDPALRIATATAAVMVVTIATHSMLEYPLWYAYFLLPTGLMLGLALGPTPMVDDRPAHSRSGAKVAPKTAAKDGDARTRPASWSLIVASALVTLGSVASIADYYRVVVIFAPPANPGPLMQRIEDGMGSVFFAHHAGYAMATTEQDPPAEPSFFKAPVYYLLDERLMSAWADAYARAGDAQKARYVARRLHEFRPGSPYFEACRGKGDADPDASAASPGRVKATLPSGHPFQCEEPTAPLTWRDFR